MLQDRRDKWKIWSCEVPWVIFWSEVSKRWWNCSYRSDFTSLVFQKRTRVPYYRFLHFQHFFSTRLDRKNIKKNAANQTIIPWEKPFWNSVSIHLKLPEPANNVKKRLWNCSYRLNFTFSLLFSTPLRIKIFRNFSRKDRDFIHVLDHSWLWQRIIPKETISKFDPDPS